MDGGNIAGFRDGVGPCAAACAPRHRRCRRPPAPPPSPPPLPQPPLLRTVRHRGGTARVVSAASGPHAHASYPPLIPHHCRRRRSKRRSGSASLRSSLSKGRMRWSLSITMLVRPPAHHLTSPNPTHWSRAAAAAPTTTLCPLPLALAKRKAYAPPYSHRCFYAFYAPVQARRGGRWRRIWHGRRTLMLTSSRTWTETTRSRRMRRRRSLLRGASGGTLSIRMHARGARRDDRRQGQCRIFSSTPWRLSVEPMLNKRGLDAQWWRGNQPTPADLDDWAIGWTLTLALFSAR